MDKPSTIISIQADGLKVSIEFDKWDTDIYDYMGAFRGMLLSLGFHNSTVDSGFANALDEDEYVVMTREDYVKARADLWEEFMHAGETVREEFD